MGSAAKFGMLVLMAMVIALARFLEGEVKPKRPQRVTKLEISTPKETKKPSILPKDQQQMRLNKEQPIDLARQVQPTLAPAQKPKRSYKVRKNDNLGRISRRYYGTTKHWKHILKANDKILKGNERAVRPGMLLVIPKKP